jgi:hypothetical protein
MSCNGTPRASIVAEGHMADHRLQQYSTTKQSVAPTPRQRTIAYLTVLLLLLGLLIGGSWYWNARPAHVQAAIADTRAATKRNDVMTVEAVTEDGVSLIGRRISIVSARVTAVTNHRTFWVVGSEGDPLLVVLGQPASTPVSTAPQFSSGERVSLTGVLHGVAKAESLSGKERAELAKTDVYLLASEVQRAR